MSETGLNLIAIAIFTMTLSSLVSPLLNISPFVPAGITFTILGLITIDTLSLQNKGINLVLDLFASTKEKERVIYHEAGHFLVAYFLGIPITDYTLTAWESLKEGKIGNGGVIFETNNLPEKNNIPLITERLSTVLMAGIEAEKLIYNKALGGEDDRIKLRELFLVFGLDSSVYQQKENWAKLQAKNIIERNKQAYQDLVEAMKNRKTVEECYLIIQATTNLNA